MVCQFCNMLMACGFLLASVMAHAQTYNVATDFSLVSNPNGVWSYGETAALTSSLLLYTNSNANFLGGLEQWRGNAASNPNLSVFFNATSSPIIGVAPGHLAFHPGPMGEFSTVRWTAPASGKFRITTLFTAIGGGNTDVHVLRGNTDLFDGTTTTVGTTASYSIPLNNVSAGETIDFKVGYGANGTYFGDTTELSAVVVDLNSVPEPGAVALFLAGALPGIEMLRRRRRK